MSVGFSGFSAAHARRLRALCLVLVVIAAGATSAAAEPQKSAAQRRYSPYERESVLRALERVNGELELEPHGKIVEGIDVVTLDVIEDRDPAPLFLNWIHATTRPYVIEREVLLRVGKEYDQRLSDETERNLRSLFLFSVVIAVPTKGSTPERVRYLVVTKDIWSLRASWDGRLNDGVVDYLSFQPTERNLFGTGRQIYGRVIFTPSTYTVGIGFLEPRLGGTRLRVAGNANVNVGCQSGEIEGSSGTFSYSLPLYSASTKWGYSTSVTWTDGIGRIYSIPHGSAICSTSARDEATVRLSTGNRAIVPNVYSRDSQAFVQSFTRSFGRVFKTNLGFGLEALRYAYRPSGIANIRPGLSAEGSPAPLTAEEMREAAFRYLVFVPSDYTRISPFFQLSAFTTNFHRDINSETLGLQEDLDFRLGPIAILKVYPALKAAASTRDLLGIQTTLSYATAVQSGFFKVSASHFVEVSGPDDTDAELSLALRFTTPRLGFGRFVYDARFVDRYRNFLNENTVLDGTTRLRGYRTPQASTPYNAIGPNWIASNLEFRSLPVQILSTQWAAVVFQDIGDAFFNFDEIRLKQGMGFGIRFLAPQLDRDVFRFDVGFPIPLDARDGDISFIAAFNQAFPVP